MFHKYIHIRLITIIYVFIHTQYGNLHALHKHTRSQLFSLERGKGAKHWYAQDTHASSPNRWTYAMPPTRKPALPTQGCHSGYTRSGCARISPHLILRSPKSSKGADIRSDSPLAFGVLIYPLLGGSEGFEYEGTHPNHGRLAVCCSVLSTCWSILLPHAVLDLPATRAAWAAVLSTNTTVKVSKRSPC